MASAAYDAYEGPYEPLPYLAIYLCLDGGGRLARLSDAQALDGLFLPGRVGLGAAHAGGTGFGPRMRLLALGVSEPRLAPLVAELPQDRFDLEAAASCFHEGPLLSAAVTAMWRHADEHGLSTAFCDHALGVIVHELARSTGAALLAGTHRLGRRQMADLIDYMEANLHRDVAVADLAALVGLSANHFGRCFRTTTGLPPYAFLTRRRLERAAVLLADTSLPVIEIAAMVGYVNPSQFSSAFRRHKGVTPLEWRRNA
ncbi:helix-turn-helix domain-containing protein [Methylobacterium oryzisoli]|uniref:helix-turn-helix domain-containing protein n=1 Tax=Methylobacterium oryzisoli TaxID=3385502 RepID=UPI0038927A89